MLHYYILTTGHCHVWEHHIMRGGRQIQMPCHALAVLVRHPTQGWIAWDTGYAPRILAATAHLPERLYRWATPLQLAAAQSLVEQLPSLGLAPTDIGTIIISHFHADHVAGLRDFPHAMFVASRVGWEHVAGRRGLAALLRGYLPALMPADFSARVRLIEEFHADPLPFLGSTYDLFGDGLLRLVMLPGHARGQMGLLAQTVDGPILFAADGVWHSRAYRERLPPHAVTRLFIDDMRAVHATIHNLHQFAVACPAVTIVPCHCPEVVARLESGIRIKQGVSIPYDSH